LSLGSFSRRSRSGFFATESAATRNSVVCNKITRAILVAKIFTLLDADDVVQRRD
jgi:hypothetical protein